MLTDDQCTMLLELLTTPYAMQRLVSPYLIFPLHTDEHAERRQQFFSLVNDGFAVRVSNEYVLAAGGEPLEAYQINIETLEAVQVYVDRLRREAAGQEAIIGYFFAGSAYCPDCAPVCDQSIIEDGEPIRLTDQARFPGGVACRECSGIIFDIPEEALTLLFQKLGL